MLILKLKMSRKKCQHAVQRHVLLILQCKKIAKLILVSISAVAHDRFSNNWHMDTASLYDINESLYNKSLHALNIGFLKQASSSSPIVLPADII